MYLSLFLSIYLSQILIRYVSQSVPIYLSIYLSITIDRWKQVNDSRPINLTDAEFRNYRRRPAGVTSRRFRLGGDEMRVIVKSSARGGLAALSPIQLTSAHASETLLALKTSSTSLL